VSYKEGDMSKFTKHMNNEHMAYFGLEYLLAGCSMSEEERLAVRDVIKDRIEPEGEENSRIKQNNTVVATLEEIDSHESKPKSGTRFPCSLCPISFTMEVNLKTHMETHEKQAKLKSLRNQNEKSRELLKHMSDKEASKTKSNKREEVKALIEDKNIGSNMKSLTSTVSVSKSLKTKGKENEGKVKVNSTGDGSKDIVEEGQDPGDGKECPVCKKQFLSNGPMRRHFEDIHQPGEFPCKGCGKIFTSKNKVSSHYSRNCKRSSM